jgi:hypothetical protein
VLLYYGWAARVGGGAFLVFQARHDRLACNAMGLNGTLLHLGRTLAALSCNVCYLHQGYCLLGLLWQMQPQSPPQAMNAIADMALQVLVELNFTYQMNEWLLMREGGWRWGAILVAAIASFGAGAAFVWYAFTYYYSQGIGCWINQTFIYSTCLSGFAMLLVLCLPPAVRAPSAGLLTSGAVWAYCCYILVSALASEPASSCLPMAQQVSAGSSSNSWVQARAAWTHVLSAGTLHYTADLHQCRGNARVLPQLQAASMTCLVHATSLSKPCYMFDA